jgi:hypothetical protein
MKILAYLVIGLLAISCLKQGENSYYVRTTARAPIVLVDIPDTTTVNQYTEITARAEVPNGCWHDLSFTLTDRSDFEYDLEAFGVFESTGFCEDIKISADTTIAFKPTKTGIYKFNVAKSQDLIVADTMIVVDAI